MLYEASKLTHDNRPGLLVEFHESFSGFRAISGTMLKDIGNLYLNLAFDGVGHKVKGIVYAGFAKGLLLF